MRTSRIAKETNALLSSTSSPPRRTTRSGRLAHFSYNDNNNNATPDIEDAIPSATPLKRKRAPTTSHTSPPSKIKAEPPSSGDETDDVKPSSESEAEETKPAPKPKPRRKPARRVTSPSGTTTIAPPTNWDEIYALVKEMRLTGPAANAAVDTMGCDRLARPSSTPLERRFHTLIALMLSSQTKDTVNAEAMKRLHTELPPATPDSKPGLTLENILAVDDKLLNELIGKVGFHNNKTKYIKQAAVILRDKHAGDIPDTIEGMMALPGVGPKMAHLLMSAENGWNRIEGIGVDVHVHRITNLWGWNSTKTPEETRMALQSWLPKELWREINWLLVGLGQAVCLPVGRKCGDCELGLRGLCRAAERKKVIEGRKRRELEVLVGEDVEGEKVVTKAEGRKKVVEEMRIKEEVVDEMVDEGVREGFMDVVKGEDGVKEETVKEEYVVKEEEEDAVKEEDNVRKEDVKLVVSGRRRRGR
ncbi:hypothetical protein OQA88_3416 [Cercophora sp. LCS_1]